MIKKKVLKRWQGNEPSNHIESDDIDEVADEPALVESAAQHRQRSHSQHRQSTNRSITPSGRQGVQQFNAPVGHISTHACKTNL